MSALEILKFDTKANLRAYLAEYNPRKRNRVHEEIRKTIDTAPQRFIIRNSGFVVTASDITIDDNTKTAILVDPSIINGSQSQGEIGELSASSLILIILANRLRILSLSGSPSLLIPTPMR